MDGVRLSIPRDSVSSVATPSHVRFREANKAQPASKTPPKRRLERLAELISKAPGVDEEAMKRRMTHRREASAEAAGRAIDGAEVEEARPAAGADLEPAAANPAPPKTAAEIAVGKIRVNQAKAKQLGVDATRRVFWSRVLGVGVAALAVTAAVAAAVATGGAAVIAAAAIAGVVCAVSMLDASCAHMNRQNALAISKGQPPPRDLPLGDSSIGNALYKVGMGIYGLHLRRTGKSMSPGGQRRVLRMAQVGDKLLRGSMVVAAVTCTAGVSAAFDSAVRIAPLVGNAVSLLHAVVRMRLDKRGAQAFREHVNSIDHEFNRMTQELEKLGRGVDPESEEGKHLANLKAALLDARTEALAEAESMKRMIAHSGADKAGALIATAALGSILLAGFAPGFHAGVEHASQVSHIPLDFIPMTSATLQTPFFASRLGGARPDGGMRDAILEVVDHARQGENGFAQLRWNQLLERAGTVLEIQNEKLREPGKQPPPTENEKRRLVLDTLSAMVADGEIRAKHVAQIIAGLPLEQFEVVARSYDAGSDSDVSIMKEARELREQARASMAGPASSAPSQAEVENQKLELASIEFSPIELDASIVLQASYAREVAADPAAGGPAVAAALRFLKSLDGWRGRLSSSQIKEKRNEALELFGEFLDAIPDTSLPASLPGPDSAAAAFGGMASFLTDSIKALALARKSGEAEGAPFDRLIARFEKAALASQQFTGPAFDAQRRQLAFELRPLLKDFPFESQDQRVQMGNVLSRLGVPVVYTSAVKARIRG